MKNWSRILTALLVTLFISQGYAQKKQRDYGSNPEEGEKQFNILLAYGKQKKYDDALNSWRYCFFNCPKASKNIFIYGEKIVKNQIKKAAKAKNNELKQKYVDTLMMVYDKRFEIFPGKNPYSYVGKKGVIMYKFRKKTNLKEAFGLLEKSVDSCGTKVPASVAGNYMRALRRMEIKKHKTCTDVVEGYLKINNIINANIDKKPELYGKLKKSALDNADKCLDCGLLDSLYTADFETFKTDTTWLDNGITLLKAKDCKSSKVLVQMMEARFQSKPDAKSATTLGKYFLGKKELAKSESYFKKAIELNTDSAKAGDYQYNLGLYYIQRSQYSSARAQGNKMLKVNANDARAYLLIGNALAYGANSCKDLTFGGQEVFWVAVDYYSKAVTLAGDDASTKQKASAGIAKYSKFFPEKQPLFLKSLNEGDSYTVGCWVNATTKVRVRK